MSPEAPKGRGQVVDVALYEAKHTGKLRSCVAVTTAGMQIAAAYNSMAIEQHEQRLKAREQELREGKVSGFVEKIQLNSNPRAKMQGIEDGFIKLICSTGGTVIGGVVIAPRASDLIYSIAVAIENRLTVDELARTFTVYPSLSGSISDAARALHMPNV